MRLWQDALPMALDLYVLAVLSSNGSESDFGRWCLRCGEFVYFLPLAFDYIRANKSALLDLCSSLVWLCS
jgi:hypothetical protein